MPLEVTVLKQEGPESIEAPPEMTGLIEQAILAAALASGYSGQRYEVNVLLTDDPGIAKYHRDYLGDDSPTDVISFAAQEMSAEPTVSGGPEDVLLGDIVLSEDTARAQALQYGHSFETEIALLAIHGFLHLTGYDDCDDGSKLKMREMEQKSLEHLKRGVWSA